MEVIKTSSSSNTVISDLTVSSRYFDDNIDVVLTIIDESEHKTDIATISSVYSNGTINFQYDFKSSENKYYYIIINSQTVNNDMVFTSFITGRLVGSSLNLNLNTGMFIYHGNLLSLYYNEVHNYIIEVDTYDTMTGVMIGSIVVSNGPGIGFTGPWLFTNTSIPNTDSYEICKFKIYCTDQSDLKTYQINKNKYNSITTSNGFNVLPDDYTPI